MFKRFIKFIKRVFSRKNPTTSPPRNTSGNGTAPIGADGSEAFWANKDFYDQKFQEILFKWKVKFANQIPRDIKNYFPKYDQSSIEKRMEFWEFFFSCVAVKESSLNPNTTYREPFNDRNGKRVVSTGLFQISVESVNGYLRHGINNGQRVVQNDLFVPWKNLDIALGIAYRWINFQSGDNVIASDGRPWLGMPRYWSVLRNNSRRTWIQNQCLQKFN